MLGALAGAGVAGLAGCLDAGGREPAGGTPRGGQSGRLERRYDVAVSTDAERFTVDIPEADYEAARTAPRSVTRALETGRESDVLAELGRRIARRFDTRAARLAAAQAFVVDVPYSHDAASTGRAEYVRYPLETLGDDTGDCDDLAVLLASLLATPALDVETGLVVPRGHCAVLAARRDLPPRTVAPDALTVTLDGREFVYVEAVARRPFGRWARDYGDRSLLAAYHDHWYPIDVDALADEAVDALEAGRLGAADQFL